MLNTPCSTRFVSLKPEETTLDFTLILRNVEMDIKNKKGDYNILVSTSVFIRLQTNQQADNIDFKTEH